MKYFFVAVLCILTTSANAWQIENEGSKAEMRQVTGTFCADEMSAKTYLERNGSFQKADIRTPICWLDTRVVAGDFSSGRIIKVRIMGEGSDFIRYLIQ